MRIAVIIERLGVNKWYAPLIREALERGHSVECWLSKEDVSTSTKWYEAPLLEKLPVYSDRAKPDFLFFKDKSELEQLVQTSQADVVFFLGRIDVAKPRHQKWAHVVSNFADSVVGHDGESLNRFDYIFCNTQHWLDRCINYLKVTHRMPSGGVEAELRRKFRTTGTPQHDHFAFCDKQAIRNKLKVPDGKKVVTIYAFEMSATFWSCNIFREPRKWKRLLSVLLLPFSYPYILSRLGLRKFFPMLWKSIVERPRYLLEAVSSPSDLDVFRSIRKFCDRNNAYFVLKFRKKHPLEKHHKDVADLLIEEDSDYFPYTSSQVISASDLVVTFFSSAAAECGFAGTPVVNLYPKKESLFYRGNYDLLYPKNAREMEDAEIDLAYNVRPGGMYNFPGLIRSEDLRRFVSTIAQRDFKDFGIEPSAHAAFVTKHIRPKMNETGSKNILDFLEGEIGLTNSVTKGATLGAGSSRIAPL